MRQILWSVESCSRSVVVLLCVEMVKNTCSSSFSMRRNHAVVTCLCCNFRERRCMVTWCISHQFFVTVRQKNQLEWCHQCLRRFFLCTHKAWQYLDPLCLSPSVILSVFAPLSGWRQPGDRLFQVIHLLRFTFQICPSNLTPSTEGVKRMAGHRLCTCLGVKPLILYVTWAVSSSSVISVPVLPVALTWHPRFKAACIGIFILHWLKRRLWENMLHVVTNRELAPNSAALWSFSAS